MHASTPSMCVCLCVSVCVCACPYVFIGDFSDEDWNRDLH